MEMADLNIYTVVRMSHTHLLGITFMFFIMGVIFSHAYLRPVWLKSTTKLSAILLLTQESRPKVSRYVLFLLCLPLLSCVDAEPLWYAHPCGNGDPISVECTDEADTVWADPSTDLCSDLGVAADAPCNEDGATCVLQPAFTCQSTSGSSSEYAMTCRNEPYPDDAGNCPMSSRSVKRDIHYIEAGERKQLAGEVLNVKLARYHYRDTKKPGLRLGYILEDQPRASFSGSERVDLYAYISAVVALTQEQQREIDSLKTEIEVLKKHQD